MSETTNLQNSKKMGFKELLWVGFTYTASGVTFTSAFAGIVSNEQSGVGWWIFLVIVASAIFMGTTSWAFKKCSKYFSYSNGGAYVYVRSAFGRFWGWMIGFVQYLAIPTSIIVSIIVLIDQNIGYLIPANVPLIGQGQKFQHLILNLISIIIFFTSSFAIYFGLKGLRIGINFAAILQFASTLVIIGCAIYLFALNGISNLTSTGHNNHLGFINFNKAEITFIYFFVGFETYATIGKNLKNPQKNLGKAIMTILALVTIFYLVVTFIFIGALGIDAFKNNSVDSGINTGNNPSLSIAIKAMGITGTVIIVISIFATKLNSMIQSSLYSGAMLEPLAIEGYISNNVAKMRKDNIPFRASFFNTLITFSLATLFIIIPNLFGKDIDFSTAVGFSSFFSIMIYIGVVLSVFKFKMQKILKLNIYEYIAMFISLISLTWISMVYFVELFVAIIQKDNLVINVVQLALLIFLTAFAVFWYYVYYNPKYKERLRSNANIQLELDRIFVPKEENWSII